MTFKHQNW